MLVIPNLFGEVADCEPMVNPQSYAKTSRDKIRFLAKDICLATEKVCKKPLPAGQTLPSPIRLGIKN